MTIEIKWDRGTEVKILPLEKMKGRVKSIWITSVGIQYEVRYFHEGKAQEVYFYEFELEDV